MELNGFKSKASITAKSLLASKALLAGISVSDL